MIEPINFFGAVRKLWRLVVVLAVIGAAVALLLPTSAPKHAKNALKFETFATVGAPASNGALSGTFTAGQINFFANTYPVKLAAVSDVGLVGNPYTYAAGMFGTTVSSTHTGLYPTSPPTVTGKAANANGGVVTLYAAAQTKQLAANLANAYAKELGTTLDGIASSRTTSGSSSSSGAASSSSSSGSPFASTASGYQLIFPGTTELAHRINLPATSTFDSRKVRLLAGLLGGIVLAILVILTREVLNKTIRRPGRATTHCKFPVIALVPETYPPDPSVVDVVDRPTSPAAEAYRKLRMSVLFEAMAAESGSAAGGDPFAEMFGVSSAQVEPYKVPEPGSRRVVLVVSTADEPSRPKVVANLAATYAEAAEHVIVVSTGDIEVGTTLPAESVLSGPLTAADIVSRLTPAGPENVWMLSMRHFLRNSSQLVSRSADVFDAARDVADVVIVEAPAFLRFHHGEAMVHSVDAVVVVVESGVTEAEDARDMGEILRRLGAPVLGVVFTGEEFPASQRRVLDAAATAAERNRAALAATPIDEVEPVEPSGPVPGEATAAAPAAAPDAAPDTATELHPT